jgi:hypothetical protein
MESRFESLLPSQPDISVFPWKTLFLPFNRATIASALVSKICHVFVSWEDIYPKLYLEGKMSRLDKLGTNALIRLWIAAENRRQLSYLQSLNPKGTHYTQEQKEYTVEKAKSIGVRATSRLLHVPRRTIQRWLKEKGIMVKRCPDWVYDWAYWRRKRKEKW